MRGTVAKYYRRVLRERIKNGERYAVGKIGKQAFNEYRQAMNELKRMHTAAPSKLTPGMSRQ
jgi:hypothetical protein